MKEKKYLINANLGESSFGKYQFEVDNSLLELFESDLSNELSLMVQVTIEKIGGGVLAHFDLDGYIYIPCDRCLETYKYDIKKAFEIAYLFDDKHKNQFDDVVIIDEKQQSIDVSQELFDYITLEIPMRKVVDESIHKCDEKVMKYLEGKSKEEESEIDERWSKLKELLDNKTN